MPNRWKVSFSPKWGYNFSMSLSRREFLLFCQAALTGLFLPPRFLNDISHLSDFGAFKSSPLQKIDTPRPEFYLTIDDGWDPDALENILAILEKNGYLATFFLVGTAVVAIEREKPGLMHKLVEAGHQIGYHTLTHRRSRTLSLNSKEWFIQDYRAWKKLLENKMGKEAVNQAVLPIARAPGGYFSPTFLGMCDSLHLIPIGWTAVIGEMEPSKNLLQQGEILLAHVTSTDAELLEKYLLDLRQIAEKGLTPALFPFGRNDDPKPFRNFPSHLGFIAG
jgi:peptidoglycan/xylan/chitin deacetylase (PgdA/CDA1 family)